MHSSSRCKYRTYLCGTANYHVSCKPVYARERKLRKSGSTFRYGTVFAPKQSLYQKEVTGIESLKMYSLVGAKTALTCARRQTIPSHLSQYRAEK